MRRGYRTAALLQQKWKDTLLYWAVMPYLQYAYAAGKNNTNIALMLDALILAFEQRADHFCIITSDSDFTPLCNRLRERSIRITIIGESRTPHSLRQAGDQFFEWMPAKIQEKIAEETTPASHLKIRNQLLNALKDLEKSTPDTRISLSTFGNEIKNKIPEFTPKKYG